MPTNNTPQQRTNRPRRRQPARHTPVLVKVLALVALAAGLALYSLDAATDFIGVGQPDREVQVVIPEGSSGASIAGILHRAGVIDHPVLFTLYTRLGRDAGSFKPGEYLLNSQMAYGDIASALVRGVERTDVVRLTFYEGMSQREIANMLEKNGVCKAQEFHDYLESGDFSGFEFARMIPEDDRFRSLEGYLFPDTYDFFKGENVSSVANKLLSRFDQQFTEEMYEQARALGMTMDDVVTLASVVQEECSDVNEMANVAAVFHNRLNNPGQYPKLQSDVTIFYVNNDISPFLKQSDQALYDQYNTYKCNGLPVGPICSPGQAALLAVLNPASSDNYYFITDKEGNFLYAKTLEEHNANIRKAGI